MGERPDRAGGRLVAAGGLDHWSRRSLLDAGGQPLARQRAIGHQAVELRAPQREGAVGLRERAEGLTRALDC